MNLRLLSQYKLSDVLHFLGLTGIAVGLVFGKAILSISLLFTLLNLILSADYAAYWQNLKSNRFFLLVLIYFLFQFVTLIWSENIAYGLHDIKVRSSLLLILLSFTIKPIDANQKQLIGLAFILSILVATVFNFLYYQGIFGNAPVDDIRGMSFFGSHVRFGLLVVIAVILTFSVTIPFSKEFLAKIGIGVWLVFYTYYSQVITGYITLSAVIGLFLFIQLWRKNKWIGIGYALLSVIFLSIVIFALFKPVKIDPSFMERLPYSSAEGNPYYHNPVTIQPETEEYAEVMICWDELEREWNKRSKLSFQDGVDAKGQSIKATLIRYMSSKDLTKDAVGMNAMSSADIKNVEQGHASKYTGGLLSRWYGIRYQILNDTDPNGHSLLERLEFWKTGIAIARDHPIFGTGIGDVQDTFNRYYEAEESKLVEENRNRTHNMILTTMISMGIVGLFLFLWFHSYFIQQAIRKENYPGIAFFTLLIVSYMIEDTLETQVGVSLAGFFLAYFNTDKSQTHL